MTVMLAVVAQTPCWSSLAPAVVGYVTLRQGTAPGTPGRRHASAVSRAAQDVRQGHGDRRHARPGFFTSPRLRSSAATIAAASLVPVVSATQPADQLGDLFALTALLMLGTFFLALGGLDPGHGVRRHGLEPRDDGGGADGADARDCDPVARADDRVDEPRRDRGIACSKTPANAIGPGHALAFAAFLIAMIAETGRLPVDNPATHLELTMIHEAMILEYSGPYLALLEWAAAFRLTLLLTLAANLFVPWGMAASLAPARHRVGLVAVVAQARPCSRLLLAVLETRVAKLRLFRVPELLARVVHAGACSPPTSSFFTR